MSVPMPADSTLERPLPNNLDAERSILGAILFDNNALNAAIEALKPDDFFIPQHRNIFTRMIALGEAQQAIDLVTLTARRPGRRGRCGGRDVWSGWRGRGLAGVGSGRSCA